MNRTPSTAEHAAHSQQTFSFNDLVGIETRPGESHASHARRFHQANPHVLDRLIAMALEVLHRNKQGGIRLLWETLRYHVTVKTDCDARKLNNNFAKWYAEEMMRREPRLAGFFKTRDGKES